MSMVSFHEGENQNGKILPLSAEIRENFFLEIYLPENA